MPANIDMSLIQEALSRRGMGGSPAGGMAMPAAGQVSAPQGTTPTGGPNTPTVQPGRGPQAPAASMAQRQSVNNVAGAAQVAQGPNFDDETKKIAKALATQLIKYV